MTSDRPLSDHELVAHVMRDLRWHTSGGVASLIHTESDGKCEVGVNHVSCILNGPQYERRVGIMVEYRKRT